MRIVVWNCATRLRGAKLKALENLQPDIAVVPDCESPRKLWGKQPLLAPIPMEWIGDDEQRGLGVLAFNRYRIERHPDYDPGLRWILPVEVRGPVHFRLLAVWVGNQPLPQSKDNQAADLRNPVMRYKGFLAAGPSVVAGDFNNNIRWDIGKKAADHARTVAGLERLGMASAYHIGRGELHGKESLATFYGRNRKPDALHYHVDYCFLPLDWCSHLRDVEVGAFAAWVGKGLSDHVPLIVDVDVRAEREESAKTAKAVRTDLGG
jgi:exodeoxyribonuclease III